MLRQLVSLLHISAREPGIQTHRQILVTTGKERDVLPVFHDLDVRAVLHGAVGVTVASLGLARVGDTCLL